MSDSIDRQRANAIRRSLLRWYDRHHRKLPWRAEPGERSDPYHALVSEAMLQQTQVAAVVGYFERFIERWPTVRSLAAADEQAVLAQWQGLGYYRRARNLHAAARQIVADGMPRSVDGLGHLAGVGRYTAGAIASMAFGVAAPIVDGNVKRVLARVEAIGRPITDRAVERRMWSLAESLVPTQRPGDFNQALMELGATVCTPRSPRCRSCPLRSKCRAFERGKVQQLPVVAKRQAAKRVRHRVYAIERDGRYLFEQRGDTGLWSGMWQLVTREHGARPAAAAWLAERTGLAVGSPKRLGGFVHITTHRHIEFVVYAASATGGRLRRGVGRWAALDDLAELPMSNAQRRAIKLVREAGGRGRR